MRTILAVLRSLKEVVEDCGVECIQVESLGAVQREGGALIFKLVQALAYIYR